MTYTVTVWREAKGGWSAQANLDQGTAFTAADSLAALDRNIRESIAGLLDLPRGAEAGMDIDLRVRVDTDVDGLVAEAVRAREAAARAVELTTSAVHELRGRGLSVRDTARLLGITSGRVAQLNDRKVAA